MKLHRYEYTPSSVSDRIITTKPIATMPSASQVCRNTPGSVLLRNMRWKKNPGSRKITSVEPVAPTTAKATPRSVTDSAVMVDAAKNVVCRIGCES